VQRGEAGRRLKRAGGGAMPPPTYKGRTMTKKAAVEVQVELPKLNIQTMQVTLIGDSSLICHAWDSDTKREMLEKQMKKAKQARKAKDPQKDFEGSMYKYPGGGYGFPTIAFKAAAVDACTHIADLTKVAARGTFHIGGELVKIEGKPTPREDMVRVGMGKADLRYRGEFKEWRTTFSLRFNANMLSPEQILNLFNTAGFAVGVGEWRPQRDGEHGMFHVATKGE